MRQTLTLSALFLALLAPASAAVTSWAAALDSSQEIPPNASTATGFGVVSFDDSTNVLSLELIWQGLTGEGMQAHIHCCVSTIPGNAGIALDLWLTSDPRPASGMYSASYDLDLADPFRSSFTGANGGTALSAFAAFRTAMDSGEGRAYFNIHTMTYPGGEIRGDLAQTPEPASVLAVLSGVGALLLRRRFARSR